MRPFESKRGAVPLFLTFAVLAWGTLGAQESTTEPEPVTEPAPLPAGEVQDFLGDWVLTLESPQGEFDTDLSIKDLDGIAIAEFEMPQLGSQTVTHLERSEQELLLKFNIQFGSQRFKINMNLAREDEGLVGKMADESGFFTMQIKGMTRQAALALATAEGAEGDSRRRRGRRRGNFANTSMTLAGQEINIRFDKPSTEQDAFQQLAAAEAGTIISFLRNRPSKLMTHTDLRFGETLIKTGNVAEDYPGVYSLWLKRVADGWSLVFNSKPDVWGTQHDPTADVAEVPLTFEARDEEAPNLTMELEEVQDGGRLRIAWGSHQWTTTFSVPDAQ